MKITTIAMASARTRPSFIGPPATEARKSCAITTNAIDQPTRKYASGRCLAGSVWMIRK